MFWDPSRCGCSSSHLSLSGQLICTSCARSPLAPVPDRLPNQKCTACRRDFDPQAISSKHKYSPFEQRRWGYRKELILHELEGYDADIVCLQEVTPGTFADDFAPWFKEKGYA